jgi:intergrase/recombinase
LRKRINKKLLEEEVKNQVNFFIINKKQEEIMSDKEFFNLLDETS